jgi:hypothetical protein
LRASPNPRERRLRTLAFLDACSVVLQRDIEVDRQFCNKPMRSASFPFTVEQCTTYSFAVFIANADGVLDLVCSANSVLALETGC